MTLRIASMILLMISFSVNALAMDRCEEPEPSVQELVNAIPESQIAQIISDLEKFESGEEKIDELDEDRQDFINFALPWLPWLKSDWKVKRYPALVAIFGYALNANRKNKDD